jgi:hypothetical protein
MSDPKSSEIQWSTVIVGCYNVESELSCLFVISNLMLYSIMSNSAAGSWLVETTILTS